MPKFCWGLMLWATLCLVGGAGVGAQEGNLAGLRSEARAGLQRAIAFYRTQVATHGGYVYHYSLDLTRRWGEGEATRDQIWVQPPGTPTVGLAYLAAYQATQDDEYLAAVQEVAEALLYGQLESGGWSNCIDFDPQGQRTSRYRNGRGGGKNNSSLDDGQTQTAIRFLLRADQALRFEHAKIHEATLLALDSLLAAQYPCGAFPQVWSGPLPQPQPRAASLPSYDSRTEGRVKEYWNLYTLNDNVAVFVAQTLRAAHAVYRQEKYLDALKRLGDFLILAQLPEPQPAWAQQYTFEMHPAWARRFEPPAISGFESQEVIALLMEIYLATGQEKYLEPLPAALAYLQRSTLADGRLARYYELQTNRPLYMEREGNEYHLTYKDDRLPDHYGWKTSSNVVQLRQALATVRSRYGQREAEPSAASLAEEVRAVLDDLDAQGRWIRYSNGQRLVGQLRLPEGEAYLSSAVFSENVTTLANFLQAE
ncbi:MAG: pectic acid lyase [Planctomycetales bacterium]|nr:pectic acid lyase [Planctomycetales bacterium]